jgi:adenine specific DNA methylase Mod
MLFQVTEIEFDFDDEDEMDAYDKDRLASETIGQIWEADDEDDLVDEITCATGWCIKSIDYRHILNTH